MYVNKYKKTKKEIVRLLKTNIVVLHMASFQPITIDTEEDFLKILEEYPDRKLFQISLKKRPLYV